MNKKHSSDLTNAAISGGLFETISRYGDAGAEFLKGLRGVDYETGQVFDRSLIKVSNYKLNPNNLEQNIKQQAGFSAEIASVSKRNAQAIINGEANRYTRSEDLMHYGKNNTVVDIVELLEGNEISTAQMKFVTRPDELLKKIARGEGGGKNDYSRYMSVDRLEVPSEQVEKMKETCRVEAEKLFEQAKAVQEKGDSQLANKLETQAKNYQKLEQKIADSGLTTKEAMNYRLNPLWETTKDIANVGHSAGIEGAKFGAAIGGGISVISNIIAVHSGDKAFGQAVLDSSKDTLMAAGVGYGTAFAGTAIKTVMQQSGSQMVRGLSRTSLPGAVVSMVLSTGSSVKRYAVGEINEGELAQEIGLKATGMLSSAMFTMIGQVAIPIPVLGGMIGGMIGYALANTFYQNFFDALNEAKLSAERRKMIEMKCAAAMMLAQQYEISLKTLFANKVAQLDSESRAMFAILENPNISADEFCAGMNRFAEMLGKKISINSMAELDQAMLSDDVLII